ncbi:MAG: hypothetical protein ACFE0I_25730 [Elainellaceae cyanobacterium]
MQTFYISPKRIMQFLLGIDLALSIASLTGKFSLYVLKTSVVGLVWRFDVGSDTSLPTWYSSFVLLICSLLLALIGLTKKQKGDRFIRHWFCLSLLFLYISVDEVATFRETLGQAARSVVETDGIFYYNWVIVAIPAVIVLALTYLKFLAHLPKPIRRLFVLSGSLFVVGAVGFEMVSSLVHSRYGVQNMMYASATTVEEFLEMIGVTIFLYALLVYVESQQIRGVQICVETGKNRSASQP